MYRILLLTHASLTLDSLLCLISWCKGLNEKGFIRFVYRTISTKCCFHFHRIFPGLKAVVLTAKHGISTDSTPVYLQQTSVCAPLEYIGISWSLSKKATCYEDYRVSFSETIDLKVYRKRFGVYEN